MAQDYGPSLPSLRDVANAPGPFDALRMLMLGSDYGMFQKQIADALQQAQGQADAASAQAQQAQQAFLSAQQAPLPTSPVPDFFQRLGGNISQAIAPGMNGQVQAEQGIAQRRQELLAKRQEHLGVLEENYRQASARAAALGDWVTKTKMDDKIASSALVKAEWTDGGRLNVGVTIIILNGDSFNTTLTIGVVYAV